MGLEGLLALFGIGSRKEAAPPPKPARRGDARSGRPGGGEREPTKEEKAAEKVRLKVRAQRTKNRVDIWKRFEPLHNSISGTMSSFYKAREKATDKIVGLKVLDPKKCAPIEEIGRAHV